MSWNFKVEGATVEAFTVNLLARADDNFGMPTAVGTAIAQVATGIVLPEGALLVVNTHGHHGPNSANGSYTIQTEAPKAA